MSNPKSISFCSKLSSGTKVCPGLQLSEKDAPASFNQAPSICVSSSTVIHNNIALLRASSVSRLALFLFFIFKLVSESLSEHFKMIKVVFLVKSRLASRLLLQSNEDNVEKS